VNDITYRTLAALAEAIAKRPMLTFGKEGKHCGGKSDRRNRTAAAKLAKRKRKIAEASRKRNRRQ
jgi:hypothetical protein